MTAAPPSEPRRFVSAHEVARRAGVSRSAVSRAFTPGASIAAETREKVERAAAELGYQVNDLARGLLANRSRLVGLVVTQPEAGYRAHLVAAMTRALIARGNVPVLIDTGHSAQEIVAAQRALIGYRAEATIVLSGSPPASFVALARQNGQPLVAIGRSEPGCDQVRTDNAGAARRAARLFAARGYTRLGFAGSASGTPSIVEREAAFLDEARRLGLPVALARGADSDYGGGSQAAEALLSGAERPQAVLCVNDLVALGLLDAARLGFSLAVPEDLSVIGFDDIPEAAWASYRLTTFRQDPAEVAAAAVALLDRRAADPAAEPGVVEIEPVMIERATTTASRATATTAAPPVAGG